jgi:hypothetical protein
MDGKRKNRLGRIDRKRLASTESDKSQHQDPEGTQSLKWLHD